MSAVTPDAADWAAAWRAALDELEVDVAHVESLLAAGRADQVVRRETAWRPPTLAGPVPACLRERASAILQRQLHAAEALAAGLTANRRQQALAARMNAGTRQERPVFVDQAL